MENQNNPSTEKGKCILRIVALLLISTCTREREREGEEKKQTINIKQKSNDAQSFLKMMNTRVLSPSPPRNQFKLICLA